MTRIIAILAAIFVLGDIGLAAALYLQTHPAAPVAVQVPVQPVPEVAQTAESDSDKRQAAAYLDIAKNRDWTATGDRNGVAEWSALDDRRYPTLCGATPTGRYYIVQNQIGSTRYDEQIDKPQLRFETVWERIGCDRTAPVHQQEILAAAARKQLYDETHPISADCLLAHIKNFAADDKAAVAKDSKDDCRRERDANGMAKGDTMPSDDVAEEHVTDANPPSMPIQTPAPSDNQPASTEQAPVP
jgi:hypothetical protein